MEQTTLGKTGFTISRLAIGGWQASGWNTSNDKSFIDTVHCGIEHGINLIDTAESYGKGHSESLIGKAIIGKRDRVFLASKFSHTNSSPTAIRSSLEGSLKRLGTDYLDLYQQHWPAKSPALDESIATLVELKKEGKIRAIGVSNWHEPEWKEVKEIDAIECLQPCYSLLWRNIEEKVVPLCLENSIGIIAYSPLCQGILCGRFLDLKNIPDDPRSKNVMLREDTIPQVRKVMLVLKKIALKHEKSMGQTALRWLLDRKGLSTAIVGASSPKQLLENLGALNWKLSSKDIDVLDGASQPLMKRFSPHQTLWKWHPRR